MRLTHELTIVARDTYVAGENGLTNPSRLRLINEVQRQVTGFLISLKKNDDKRYPDDTLARLILEHPQHLELQRELLRAFGRLMAQMATTT